jgi:hypothetical protein
MALRAPIEELGAMAVDAVGAEVVVDDVDEHHQAERMRAVDERLELVGVPYEASGAAERRRNPSCDDRGNGDRHEPIAVMPSSASAGRRAAAANVPRR